jgi:hypothetical protein
MEQKQQIIDELKEISPFLAENRVSSPYQVPAGYFNNLADTVMDRITVGVVLPEVPAASYQVPVGYFEGLAGNILSKIHRQGNVNDVRAELEEIAPMLNSISRSNVYAAPEGYFDRSIFIPASEKKAKVVKMNFAKRWTQYAAAAVMAGILVTGAFLYTDNNKSEFDQQSQVDVPSELNKLSENELVKYLDNPEQSIATNVVNEAQSDVKNLSDEELDQYLKENADADLFISTSNN